MSCGLSRTITLTRPVLCSQPLPTKVGMSSIRFVTYNVLGPSLARSDWFSTTPKELLKTARRLEALVRALSCRCCGVKVSCEVVTPMTCRELACRPSQKVEIELLKADVLCLQVCLRLTFPVARLGGLAVGPTCAWIGQHFLCRRKWKSTTTGALSWTGLAWTRCTPKKPLYNMVACWRGTEEGVAA